VGTPVAAALRMSAVEKASGVETIIAGIAGAVALTAVHQLGQRIFPDAPRMDIVGMRALASIRAGAGMSVPDRDTLYRQTLAGDLASNAAYYSLVGIGPHDRRWARGAALGVAAGLGAVALPQPLGLGRPPHSDSPRNQILTVAWYTLGGLTAAAMLGLLRPPASRPDEPVAGTPPRRR